MNHTITFKQLDRAESRLALFLLSAIFLASTSCSDDAGEPNTHTSTQDTDSADASGDGSEDPGDTPEDGGDMLDGDVADDEPEAGPPIVRDGAPEHDGIYGFAGGCFSVEGFAGFEPGLLKPSDDGSTFAFVDADLTAASRFHMRATDLGSYLLYDSDAHYLIARDVAEDGADPQWHLHRVGTLDSDVTLLDDSFRSPAEWELETSARDPERFQLRHYQTGWYLALEGLTESESDAAVITFFAAEGCAEFPELPVDAVGTVAPTQWDDGDVYGIAEVHSHLMTNFGFGGGGSFHGAPFHRLGVEHALRGCEGTHGEEGRRDLVGLFYDRGLDLDLIRLLPIIGNGESDEFNHFTAGYPEFTDWPNGWGSSTHQTMYYRWLERAYLGGVRLVVQHATGNSVLCEFVTGVDAQQTRYSCNDMVSVDRSIEEVRNLERYIDAQSGGPGQGWFRVVESPEQARAVINDGKMAVVLGIEISNLFDCFLTPPEGFDRCDANDVREQLDRYHALGVRVIFPVHKFDNGFAAGDGSGGVIELANFINSGHYTNMVEDCPMGSAGFDSGDITFGGLNVPRDPYQAPPPADMTGFQSNPVFTLLPHLRRLQSAPARGNFCQNAGMTDLGETLVFEMMERGMLVDMAHLPQRGVVRALEIFEDNDYPATSTHGQTYGGDLYRLGGMSQTGFGGCGNPDVADTMGNRFRSRVQQRTDAGAYPAEGFGFDFNGFAGARRPRFGDDSRCSQPQAYPVTYPFTSFDGEVEFEQPTLGDRVVDFNTEGMLHIGLLPELIEDVRRDGMSDEDLEPLFRSAEAYLRMWAHAEARAAALRGE